MQSQLYELCTQFEQVLVGALVSKSSSSSLRFGLTNADADESSQPSRDVVESLFSQAFAVAIERAGGLGLSAEVYHSLTQVQP
jgi:hypothetical protein